MRKALLKVLSVVMASVTFFSIVLTGGITQNNSVIQAVVSTLGTIGTKSLDVTGDIRHVEKKAEKPAADLKAILKKYDTGKPVSEKIDIKDDLKKMNDTYTISSKQFTGITGDTCSFSSTGSGILLRHGDYTVALNENDNLMVVNDDEYHYLPSPLTKDKTGYHFPVEDVAEGLGYSVTQNKDELTLSREYQSKRILVKTEEKLTDTQDAVATAEVIDDVYALQYDSEAKAEEACEYFYTLESIDYAQPDAIVTAAGEEVSEDGTAANADGTYYSWGAQAMGVDDYTDYLENTVGEINLNDVVIAVLDTGIDTDHPWFSGRIADNGANFSSSVSSTAYSYEDVYGHGSHVSGIICDLTLDNVKILPVKVLDDEGYGYTSSIVQGIDFITQQKQNGQNICAMNMSLGVTSTSQDLVAYQDAISDAYNSGVLTVVAAGNDGDDTSNTTPANVEKAITVAAVGQSVPNYFRPGWSNYGSYVDLSAPGYMIESACAGGGTVVMSGTSMAAPHVAAAIALLKSNSLKSYNLQGIEDALDYFSTDLGNAGWDPYFGAGMVNLEYAYAASMSQVAFSQTTNECTAAFDLTLTCPETGAQIYYTLDGSTPSKSNGNLYTGFININSTVTVKAIAYVFDNNTVLKCSRISSITYYFYGQDLPNAFTVSITGELISYTGISTNVTVPGSVNGITVTSIGSFAFSSVGSSLVSVTLPSTVIGINDNAFNGCIALTQVYAPSVTKIGMYAFCQCSSFKYVQDLYFPELLSIGKFAFYRCYNLQPVTLSKVTLIDDWAFGMGPNIVVPYLTSVMLPSVKTIGESGFFNCNSLSAIEIPSAECICANAFRACDLRELNLPSAKYLGNNAFYVNENLSSADLPEAIIIGDACFYYYCKSLSTLNIPNVERIGSTAFRECLALTELNVPSAEFIDTWAFYDCDNLTTVNAPKLKDVNYVAFGHCNSLREVYLPGIVKISPEAFRVAASLTKVTLSSCIEAISPDAFKNSNKSCVFYIYGGTAAENFAVSNNYTYVNLAPSSNCFVYQKINNSEIYITGYTAALPAHAVIPSYIEGLPVTKICTDAFKTVLKWKRCRYLN